MSVEQFEKIKALLGKPSYCTEGLAIYNMDCLQGMKNIREETFALTVTSPPYNIGKEYETALKLDEYISWCKNWIEEVHRITMKKGAFWLNLGYLEVMEKD